MKSPSAITRVADELGSEMVVARALAKRATGQLADDLGEMAKRLEMLGDALRAETRTRGSTNGAAG